MNELGSLSSLGLALPSPLYFVGSLLFGIIGYVVFRRGRRMSSSRLTWGGVTLMVYPMFVSETWLMWDVGAGLCLWLHGQWE